MIKKEWTYIMLFILGLVALLLGPAPVWADGALVLTGTPQVTPTPLVPGKDAIVKVPVKTGKEPARQVRLEIKLAQQVIGELTGGPLGANQANTYEVKIAVPANATGSLTLTIWGQGTQLGQFTAQVQPRPPIAVKEKPGTPPLRAAEKMQVRPERFELATRTTPLTPNKGWPDDTVQADLTAPNASSGSVSISGPPRVQILRQTGGEFVPVPKGVPSHRDPGGSRPREGTMPKGDPNLKHLTLGIDAGATPGPRDIILTTPDGRSSVVAQFTVVPRGTPIAPTIRLLQHPDGPFASSRYHRGTQPPVQIVGNYLDGTVTVEGPGGVSVLEVQPGDRTRNMTTRNLRLSIGESAVWGEHTLKITNPAGTDTIKFPVYRRNPTITPPRPEPTFGLVGTNPVVTLRGTHLYKPGNVRISLRGRPSDPGGVHVRRVEWNQGDESSITLHLTIAANAPTGDRNIEVEFPVEETRSRPIEFRVVAHPPTITSVSMYVRNWSQFDVNEVWLVRGGGPGIPLVRELLTRDLSRWQNPVPPGGSGPSVARYNDEILTHVPKRHDPSQEPNVTPYYILEYIQERLTFDGQPIYHERPLSSTAFAPGVHHVAGYTIVRETLFTFSHSSLPTSRHEQILRGPEGRLYLYRPGSFFEGHPEVGHGPILLQTLVNEGYRAYDPSQLGQ